MDSTLKCLICHTTIIDELSFQTLFKPHPILCESCTMTLKQYKFNTENRCNYCLGKIERQQCVNCTSRDYLYRFDSITACFHYDGFYKSLYHQYKFLGDVVLANVIAHAIRIPYHHFDMVIPVPSVEENDLKRTFNPVQTILIAAKVPFQNCLKMNQRPKQFTLNFKERINLENGILIQGDIQLENKRILLIDDIYTTGQTAHNVAVKLFSKKVRKLSMLTFAR